MELTGHLQVKQEGGDTELENVGKAVDPEGVRCHIQVYETVKYKVNYSPKYP